MCVASNKYKSISFDRLKDDTCILYQTSNFSFLTFMYNPKSLSQY